MSAESCAASVSLGALTEPDGAADPASEPLAMR